MQGNFRVFIYGTERDIAIGDSTGLRSLALTSDGWPQKKSKPSPTITEIDFPFARVRKTVFRQDIGVKRVAGNKTGQEQAGGYPACAEGR
jgi:hypothetical protein